MKDCPLARAVLVIWGCFLQSIFQSYLFNLSWCFIESLSLEHQSIRGEMLTAGFLPKVEEKGLVGCVCRCGGGTSVILPGSLQCWVSPGSEQGQLTGPGVIYHNISSSCKEDIFHGPHLFE